MTKINCARSNGRCRRRQSQLLLLLPGGLTKAAEPVQVTDCFAGVLDHDPMHCRVLEGAHNSGDIAVAGIYVEGRQLEDRALYVFLSQGVGEWESVISGLVNRTGAFISASDQEFCPRPRYGCEPEFQNDMDWIPTSSFYSSILIRPGGIAALRQLPAWASFRQIWPSVAQESVTTRSSAPQSFDISGVEMGDIPEADCTYKGRLPPNKNCAAYKYFPDLHLAGWFEPSDTHYKAYVQVKAEPGEEDDTIAATKAALREYEYYPGDQSTFIYPVKYDYGEYWRWAVILNRFIRSSGNTLGIVEAYVGYNWGGYTSTFREASGLEDVPHVNSEPERLRTTLKIVTIENNATLSALPRLLVQLGIPNDAVGVVKEIVRTPVEPAFPFSATDNPNPSESDIDPPPESNVSEPIAQEPIESTRPAKRVITVISGISPPTDQAIAEDSPSQDPINGGLLGALLLPLLIAVGYVGYRLRRTMGSSVK